MGALLQLLGTWIIGSNVAKLFAGVGIAIVSQVFLTGYVEDALSSITSSFGGVSGNVGNIFLMLGFGAYLSIIGSAFLTRVTVQQMAKTWGITNSSAT